MQSHARAVVIGGGVTGCSILYHLAKMGWRDVVLLERKELTSGSSWHAAGGLFALTAPNNAAALQKYTLELYPELEKESEQDCGLHLTGGISLVRSEDEMTALKVAISRGRRLGIEADFISMEEARRKFPLLETDPVKAVLYEPLKGHCDPASVTYAYAKAARKYGAVIHRHTEVLETKPTAEGGWRIVTDQGEIVCDVLVNAAGLWAREVAAMAGITLPLLPVEHHYLVTESIPEIEAMDHRLTTLADKESGCYMRQEGQGLLLGAYEKPCVHWAVSGTPLDFDHELLPDDVTRMEENFARMTEVVPALGEVGVKRVINGPMIFSPDLQPLIGPYPGLRNYFCANGVMTAFNQAGGIGKVLAEWIIEGEPSLDVFFWDVARFGDWAGKRFTAERTKYFYEHRTSTIYPGEEFEVGRPLRTTPIYGALKAAGAVFGQAFGLEVPQWYAPEGMEALDRPSFQRPNWHEPVGAECRAVRDAAGIFEISGFGKIAVKGEGAGDWLDRLLANRVPRRPGRIALSAMLSDNGKLLGDFSVTCLGEDNYLLLGAGALQLAHLRHFALHHPGGGLQIENLSTQLTGLMVAGPAAREILGEISDADFSNEGFPFLSAREIELGLAPGVVAARVSFTGELGWELYCRADYQHTLYNALLEAGKKHGLRAAGTRAMMSMRLEKAFPAWGLELSPDYGPYEAGLDRFVKLDKEDFIGRSAALSQKQQGPESRLSLLKIDDSGLAADPVGGEAVFRDGELVGYVTSGGYGHRVTASLALAYIKSEALDEAGEYLVEILGEKRPALYCPEALYDPKGVRLRS